MNSYLPLAIGKITGQTGLIGLSRQPVEEKEQL